MRRFAQATCSFGSAVTCEQVYAFSPPNQRWMGRRGWSTETLCTAGDFPQRPERPETGCEILSPRFCISWAMTASAAASWSFFSPLRGPFFESDSASMMTCRHYEKTKVRCIRIRRDRQKARCKGAWDLHDIASYTTSSTQMNGQSQTCDTGRSRHSATCPIMLLGDIYT